MSESSRSGLARFALITLVLALGSSGCNWPWSKSDEEVPGASADVPDPRTVLTLPSKDDVALIDGRPLSITAFSKLRNTFPELKRESLLWMGLGAMALQNRSKALGFELRGESAIGIARYAVGDLKVDDVDHDLRLFFQTTGPLPTSQRVREEIDDLLKRSSILRNPQALGEFHDNG